MEELEGEEIEEGGRGGRTTANKVDEEDGAKRGWDEDMGVKGNMVCERKREEREEKEGGGMSALPSSADAS